MVSWREHPRRDELCRASASCRETQGKAALRGEQRDLDSESDTCKRGVLATRLPLLGEESA